MNQPPSKDPLHGITLEMMLKQMIDYYGFDQLYYHVPVNCFGNNPSLKSSLTFLRKTPWARTKVEKLYLRMIEEQNR
ncbi:MAG: VF530 family protein [Spirosomaceae bacterium]|jgi:uncharacterized protein (DUF2132 family)|nr:VF530 family protein [Spirosomataceae bacterium]